MEDASQIICFLIISRARLRSTPIDTNCGAVIARVEARVPVHLGARRGVPRYFRDNWRVVASAIADPNRLTDGCPHSKKKKKKKPIWLRDANLSLCVTLEIRIALPFRTGHVFCGFKATCIWHLLCSKTCTLETMLAITSQVTTIAVNEMRW